MKTIHLGAAAVAIAGLLGALPAAAQFQTPESAIKYRQGAFSVMAAHFSRVAMMAQGILPYDAKVAIENAELVATMAKLPFSAFGPGTDKGFPTRAKAEIWKDPVKFKAASDRMVADAAKLDLVARTGNPDLLKAAVGAVGQGCKSCHDDFRGQRTE